jgi:hypothetical protein
LPIKAHHQAQDHRPILPFISITCKKQALQHVQNITEKATDKPLKHVS